MFPSFGTSGTTSAATATPAKPRGKPQVWLAVTIDGKATQPPRIVIELDDDVAPMTAENFRHVFWRSITLELSLIQLLQVAVHRRKGYF
jgi:hypothetical protein